MILEKVLNKTDFTLLMTKKEAVMKSPGGNAKCFMVSPYIYTYKFHWKCKSKPHEFNYKMVKEIVQEGH